MLVFRSHDVVPESITSPTLIGLAEEWVAINATAEYHRQVAQMGFPGCTRPGDVLDMIDSSTDVLECNDVLYRLVTHDSYLSSRMVLQALLPRILKIALGRAARSETLEDHLQILITEVWESIASYPAHCTRYVAYNLTRRHGFPQETDDRCVPVAEIYETADTTAAEAELELNLLLDAGLRAGAVSSEDVDLLLEIYVQGYNATEAAKPRNVSAAAIRKRCQRALSRLSASVA